MNTKDKVISMRVSLDFDRQLRIEAAKRDLNRSAFIRKALNEKLSNIMKNEKISVKSNSPNLRSDMN
jgi:hypothetical protein